MMMMMMIQLLIVFFVWFERGKRKFEEQKKGFWFRSVSGFRCDTEDDDGEARIMCWTVTRVWILLLWVIDLKRKRFIYDWV